MTTHRSSLNPARWLSCVVALAAALFVANAPAQAPAAPGNAPPPMAEDALEWLVGRIALYPDDLVAIILPASTNPLQLVQADRFLEKRKSDPKLPVDEKWDDAVKSLLNYPEVVKMMSADLDWTSALGEEVVADQGAVLEAIQVFRRKTQAAGNLKSDPKQTVVVEKEVIKIVPADPQVIYVPQYNPSTVVVAGGYSSWGYYPSPYPVYYYPYAPGAAFATGLIWGAAITAAWNGGRYGASWSGGNNTINIDRSTNINRSGGTPSQRPAGGGSGSTQWRSNKQPGQVSSSTGRTQQGRVGDTGRGGARPSTQPSGGGRDFGGGPSSGGAFGGSNTSGRQAHMDSSRGAQSRGGSSSISGSGPRQVPSSGGVGAQGGRSGRSGASTGGGGMGARAGGGGGGGGRGGGGGGGRR
ncbi:MAG TPA: DUF3300 domain-containing protein [Burkholderiales bacterium]|nr:DUF3300 domain-containing protein [Burkholderiales bacterium]